MSTQKNVQVVKNFFAAMENLTSTVATTPSWVALLAHRTSIVPAYGRLPAPSPATSDAPDRRRSVGATFVKP
jgi:hypothetical protein